jgi:hypothetical protein
MKMTVFWDAAPFSLVQTDRRFRDAYSPDDGGVSAMIRRFTPARLHDDVFQKTGILMRFKFLSEFTLVCSEIGNVIWVKSLSKLTVIYFIYP